MQSIIMGSEVPLMHMIVLMIVGNLEDRGVAYTCSIPQQRHDICRANHGTIVHMGTSLVNIHQ
jgi:hypothetical protein